jgi:Cd(II)/Pb(II)-responsive transcriptional regulator
MKIGELARATQVQVETIRYYEREGLLPPAPRSDANYRVYAAPHVERLTFIRHCRALDLTLDEIRALLRIKDDPAAACGEVNALLDEHIGHVAARIRGLKHLQQQLQRLREQCAGGGASAHCAILGELAQAAGTAPKRRDGVQGGHAKSVHGRGV